MKEKQVSVTVTESVYELVKQAALNDNRSIRQWLSLYLKTLLEPSKAND